MNVCSVCQKPKAGLDCGICKEHVCKSCAQFLADDDFAFLSESERTFAPGSYCAPCFDDKISPAKSEYDDLMERAKDINVYFKNQSKETRLIRRHREILRVKDCDDRDETVMRLAFQAAAKGFNALVDVEVESEKVSKGGRYQTSKWNGTGLAANIDTGKLPPPEFGSPN